MTKAEKNYRCYSLKEELDNVLETVNPDDLTADEKAYMNGRNQRKNHTLNICLK